MALRKLRRRNGAALAVSALLAVSGCHAGTSGNVNRPAPTPPVTRQDLTVTRIVAQHNRNAAAVRSIQAAPTIYVVRGGPNAKVDGRLALERPKDFRLKLSSFGNIKADIGSNDDGFWFWIDEDADKKIYTCRHDQVDASPLTITLQPDWIVEAMGLREFTAEEARTISSKPDGRPGLMVLTQFRKDARGQELTKETVVEEATGEVREHRLWAGAKKELLASAVISKYRYVALTQPSAADPEPEAAEAAPSTKTTVRLPSRFRLSWVKEKFELDIVMDRATINPAFRDDQRADFFTEPKIPGVARQDLAALGNGTPSSRLYESRPSPRPGIGLGEPEPAPIDVDGAYRKSVQARPLSAGVRRSTAPPTAPAGGVVYAPIPTGPDPEAIPAGGGSNRLLAPPQ